MFCGRSIKVKRMGRKASLTTGNLAGTKTVLSAQLTNLYRLGVGRHKYSIMVRNGRLFSTFFIAFDSKSRARA